MSQAPLCNLALLWQLSKPYLLPVLLALFTVREKQIATPDSLNATVSTRFLRSRYASYELDIHLHDKRRRVSTVDIYLPLLLEGSSCPHERTHPFSSIIGCCRYLFIDLTLT